MTGARPRAPGTTVLLALILALTFATYARTLTFGFVYDDQGQILENRPIRHWNSLPRVLESPVWFYVAGKQSGAYYRPVFSTWLMALWSISGPRPAVWHLASVLVHLAATAVVFLLALRLLGEPMAASAAALVFGVHPVHVESVAWISGITDPLMALLGLAALLCHLHGRERGSLAWRAAALGLFALSLLEKETAAVLPGLVAVWEWWLAPRPAAERPAARLRRAALALAPWAAVLAAWLALRAVLLGNAIGPSGPLYVSTVLLTIPRALWFYLSKLLWPATLAPAYDLGYAHVFSLRGVLAPAAAIAGLIALALWAARGRPVVWLALALVALPLLPVLDLALLPQWNYAHDRYLYLPVAGLGLLAGQALLAVPAAGSRAFGLPLARLVPVVAITAALCVRTVTAAAPWRDNASLFSHAVAVCPTAYGMVLNLGTVYQRAGRLDEAERLYRRVLAHRPDYLKAAWNIGQVEMRRGHLHAAERWLRHSLSTQTPDADQYIHLGTVQRRLGQLHAAERSMRQAIRMRPEEPGYHFALGVVLEDEGRSAEALAAFRRERDLNPDEPLVQRRIKRLEALAGAGS